MLCQLVVHAFAAAPHSPPVRDSDPLKQVMSQEERTVHEIQRLHHQIGTCIHQIQRLQEAAAYGEISSLPLMFLRVSCPFVSLSDAGSQNKNAKMYAEDIEEERRRQARAEEQTTRSTRNIYQLGQQVKNLQEEIGKLEAGPIKHSKKVSSPLLRPEIIQLASCTYLAMFHSLESDLESASCSSKRSSQSLAGLCAAHARF